METTVLRRPTPADPDAIDVAPDLACLRSVIVNVYLYGEVGAPDREWVLIDAGIPGSTGRILRAAEERFGPGKRPACIVLTHGHFDHVGALRELAERWDCPVYAHPLEMPYITGRSSYPPPDPTVGGGAMALMSPLYPRGPIDLTGRTQYLPADGTVPGMPGWRWLHTPGHCPGTSRSSAHRTGCWWPATPW
jgi:glyoxylase-like metal-dependent hydrolase (beta-lactamase superfamily II)